MGARSEDVVEGDRPGSGGEGPVHEVGAEERPPPSPVDPRPVFAEQGEDLGAVDLDPERLEEAPGLGEDRLDEAVVEQPQRWPHGTQDPREKATSAGARGPMGRMPYGGWGHPAAVRRRRPRLERRASPGSCGACPAVAAGR